MGRLSLICLALTAVVQCTSAGDLRPFYNIAHMANSIMEARDFLDRGANALEVDVAFHTNGSVRGVYHAPPCDCFRVCEIKEDFTKYLNYIHDISDQNHVKFRDQLALLFLDLKVSDLSERSKYKAGVNLADNLMSHLWKSEDNSTLVNVLVSIGHISDNSTIRGVITTLKEAGFNDALENNIGWDIGLNDRLESIGKLWKDLGISSNRWQGDGLTNCFSTIRPFNRIQQAVKIRDQNSSFIEKTYHWTLDLTDSLKASLRRNVDGIITNWPDRLDNIIKSTEFETRYRLASPRDSPWKKFKGSKNFKMPNAWNGLAMMSQLSRRAMVSSVVNTASELLQSFVRYFWDVLTMKVLQPRMVNDFLEEILYLFL